MDAADSTACPAKPDENSMTEFTFDDPYLSTNPPIVNWAPWQPSGRDLDNSNCLILRSQIPSMEIDGIDDYTCNSTISDTGKSVFIGAVCGEKPLIYP
uniref:Ig-like domain-containing protein n=1 Tax=Caenorhabditis tropicalis TaxID=1561998 RepID=A0A1I7UWN9_9PELO